MDDQTDTVNTTEPRGRKHLKPMHGTRIYSKVEELANDDIQATDAPEPTQRKRLTEFGNN